MAHDDVIARQAVESDLRIARVEAFRLRLPYKGEVSFKT